MMLGFSPLGSMPLSSLPGGSARGVISIRATTFLAKGTARGVVSLKGFANWDFRIFAASRDYISAPTDAIPNRNFHGTLTQPLEFTRSILGFRIGEMQVGFGEMILDNTEGDYDYLIRDYAIDGRRIVVRIGDGEQAYDTFGIVFDGTATGWHVEEGEFRVSIRDYGYRLEVPAQPNTYAGTGGVEGGEDLKGKRKPRTFGQVANIFPPLVVPNKNAYQVNDGPIEAVDAVYVRGNALQFNVDHSTVDALLAATIPGAKFDTCRAAGWFRLNFTTDQDYGQITADVRGDKAGGVYAKTSADIIRRLLRSNAGLAASEIAEDSFAAVNSRQPATIGMFLAPDEEINVDALVNRITTGIGGWGGFRRNGQFEVGIFTAPANPPRIAFDRVEIIEIERMEAPEFMSPPPWRQRVIYARNWTVQTDPAGVVTENQPERAAYLKERYRLAVAADDAVKADHPLAQDPAPLEAYFANEADATAEATRVLDLYKRPRSLYRVTLKTQPFLLEIGDVVAVTYPRWDLGGGKLLRIVELREDGQSNSVEIVGFG